MATQDGVPVETTIYNGSTISLAVRGGTALPLTPHSHVLMPDTCICVKVPLPSYLLA